MRNLDVNKYKKIIIFGNINGCLFPLEQYFKMCTFDENNLYIFTGGYFNKTNNKDFNEWLKKYIDKDNVIFLRNEKEKGKEDKNIYIRYNDCKYFITYNRVFSNNKQYNLGGNPYKNGFIKILTITPQKTNIIQMRNPIIY